ncbi:small conductance mechanosensitive channel [Modicisalibacter muralis]|uniref:Small conductance mechanosensitive channel n=1 Tax=Modicisalibacter muralis TaxID=119000 RepID=A0A1G9NKR1_9GAMM|nr:mechanosensitive channel protein [Halomonas muralis]SDL86903.1 small conductance mechanosensitive channel [Halomonas muralis]
MLTSRLNTWLGYWLAIMLMTIALPVFAQQGETPPEDTADGAPAYSTLADLLEDDQARQRLIEELRSLAAPQEGELGLAGEETPATIAEQAPSGQSAEQVSLARRLAAATSNIAGNIGGQFTNLMSVLGALVAPDEATEGDTATGPEFDMTAFTSAAIELALIIVATFVAFFILRRLARPLFTRLSHWSMHGDSRSALLRVIVAVALAAAVDVAVVALAYIGGNLLATFAVGGSGELPAYTALFLNAFLIVELFKAAIRMLFSSGYEGLRLLPISADEAASWNRWLASLSGFVGYGMLVLVPIVNFNVSPALGQATGFVVMLLAFIYATTFVLKNRLKLRGALEARAANASMSASRMALVLLGKCWHLLAIAYFLLVLVLGVTRPEEALPYVMLATLQTLIIIGVGLLISGVLTQVIGKRIRLSDDLRRKLPKLETRLNSYIPTFLKVIRAIILIAVVMLVLNAWGAFDLAAWYATEAGSATVGKLIDVLVILIVAAALWIALASLIEHRLSPETGIGEPSARTKTLLSLFRNALAIALITITAMIVLAEIGVNIGPLIAGAGVLGLAIGFGAQKMVQDIITGVFIQVENAMNTGDVVTLAGITGTAERLSIRSVGIRDLAGTYHIIPFSSVDTVSNYMRGFGNHVGEYGISYRENIDEAIAQLELAFEELKASEEHGHKLLEPLSVAGVIALADNSVNIRVILKTTPGDQWGVGRAYNRLVKMYFEAAGIEIPFPHTTLYFGQDKTGSAPPANLRIMQQDFTIDGSPAGQPKPRDIEPPEALDPHDDTAIPKAHTQPDSDEVDER